MFMRNLYELLQIVFWLVRGAMIQAELSSRNWDEHNFLKEGGSTHLYWIFWGSNKAAIGEIVVRVAKCGDVF